MAAKMNDNRATILEEALTRFVDVYLRGEQPDVDEFVEQYPQCKAELKERIQDLQEIDSLFDSIVHADESDFQDAVTVQELVGRKLGSFEVKRVIGRGGMGVVYLARDTKLDRPVAIKSMPAALRDSPTAQTRFRREARLLASLNHPNIAVIHDIIEQDEGAGYLILEYVPGETLAQRISAQPLNLGEALTIGQQIAEAISVAHERGVIHRDLKPGNIKITPDSRVKVLDFGLAKASGTEDKAGETTITRPGRVIGTPAYMSPEQVRGKSTDHRTDVWSFGCVMYEMLAGHLPFEGETVTDTVARILEREPDWELLPQDTPVNIRVLLRRCLEKDTQQRHQRMDDAAIEIRKTLNLRAAAPLFDSSASVVAPKTRLRAKAIFITAAIIIILSAITTRVILRKQTGGAPKEKVLVVLPFENLGPADDDYFAAGITSEITARLAGIPGLGVISRQSALQYKNRDKTAQQIGKELGVDYILEGTVQHERPSDRTSQLRIIPQLIRVSDDRQIWAEPYDSNMTGVFRMQYNIAERVAQALDITLLEPERLALRSQPTENLEAYDNYLRGTVYMERGCFREENARIAVQMYQKAVDLDPQFTLAYAELVTAHLSLYKYRHDHSDSRLAAAKQAIDMLLQLDSDLPETHRALGIYHYWGHLKYDRALEEFSIAIKSRPNDALLFVFTGAVHRRMGRFDKALAEFRKAYKLDPRSSLPALLLAETYALLRNYPEALRHCDRAIALSPDLGQHYGRKIKVLLSWQGKTGEARAVLRQAKENVDVSKDDFLAYHATLLEIFDGNYQEARKLLSEDSPDVFRTQFFFVPMAQLQAQISGLQGDEQVALDYYDSARVMLEAKIQEQPEDAQFHSALGIAYAGLGRKEDAIREGELAVEILPLTKEAWAGLLRLEDLARIYTMVGEHDAAIDRIEYLLSMAGELSIRLLLIDPVWYPLRDHPRFQKLLEAGR